jgi:hypothetical protein
VAVVRDQRITQVVWRFVAGIKDDWEWSAGIGQVLLKKLSCEACFISIF